MISGVGTTLISLESKKPQWGVGEQHLDVSFELYSFSGLAAQHFQCVGDVGAEDGIGS